MDKIDIKTLTLDDLEKEILYMGEPKFRAKQIFSWLHQKNVCSFDEMSNISKDFREKLSNKFKITEIEILDKLVSSVDKTTKYLFKLENNYIIESVLMKYSYGNAVCISSQVGCRMGCKFCASTLDGLERSLTVAEMVSQIYEIQKESKQKIRSIVLMGSGEPFDNFENFLKFIEIINHKDGLNIGQRHITVSTCGIVPKIYELADKKMQINLALSLHAPTDEDRKKIMPIANKYTVKEIVEACKYFANTTKRRVTYEYALIAGVNDREEDAKEIIRLLKGSLAHINLIPVNDVKERNYIKSSKEQIRKFADTLINAGIETTIRRELGSDINAACGQLRKSYKY
ncbi:23S rRNA (adenine(2503)-C(2))-methyltransferase RlmN [uncultured Tyzzerella sp.]|uniref:23S rRNA (adenine(2503)-C(2))-methyltransferase RlmN n=1 Tax=uncultured Tyzzerella sp. TaxID=2321398 RepID=UPI0029425F79|nr:23S rRNA (adenine(2503)-C(2))-methyltransferase RlmN [uncultured Tyzzerella sp.]